jgi:hypothetical protein
MMYDTSGAGENLRKYIGLSLAWWHNYKWVAKRIIIVFSNDFFGPMFHYLYPTAVWRPKKLRLSVASTYLQYVRLAYPAFQASLRRALGRGINTPRQRRILTNLQQLCEFFIPVVSNVWFSFTHPHQKKKKVITSVLLTTNN